MGACSSALHHTPPIHAPHHAPPTSSSSTSTTTSSTRSNSDDNMKKHHEAASFIHSIVNQHCVVIFSKTDCPYSNRAKQIFDTMGVGYQSIELNQRDDCRMLQHVLCDISGERTVPRVFVNGNCIGGGTDTEKLYNEGKLVFLLDQCANVIGSSENDNSSEMGDNCSEIGDGDASQSDTESCS